MPHETEWARCLAWKKRVHLWHRAVCQLESSIMDKENEGQFMNYLEIKPREKSIYNAEIGNRQGQASCFPCPFQNFRASIMPGCASSIRLRPPPERRSRRLPCSSFRTSPDCSSAMPLRSVIGLIRNSLLISFWPPDPSAIASLARYSRRCRSDRCGRIVLILSIVLCSTIM